ncbi:DNA repair protein RadC [Clostridium swellfunianum]|nr:JAB domain-containing protein [Clostridium swellfunianum]MCM0648426.1 DNA repair protein RadC [Clostridium swellfunianum]
MELILNENKKSKIPAKRVSVVSIKIVRESSVLYEGRTIGTPSDAAELGRRFLEDSDREKLIVCCLDTKNQPISVSIVSVGSLNSSIFHPREIFKTGVLSNAASVIVFHNHPSGITDPSTEDIEATKRIKEAGKIIGIEVLDHIIVGQGNKFCSMKEKGIL